MGIRPKIIELHIEELVLQGVAVGDRYRLAEALKRELTRLLIERGTPPSLLRNDVVARLDGGAFEVKQDASAEATGGQVAQGVYEGLSR